MTKFTIAVLYERISTCSGFKYDLLGKPQYKEFVNPPLEEEAEQQLYWERRITGITTNNESQPQGIFQENRIPACADPLRY